MKITLSSLLALAVMASPVFTASAAEPKRVIVCTATKGFRHGSIPFAEKTLQKLADESKAYVIVDWVQNPKGNSPNKPNPPGKPRDLKPDADDAAKAKYATDMEKFDAATKRYEEAFAKYQAEVSKPGYVDPWTAQMDKLSPANLEKNQIDMVIFANTTGELPLPDKEGFIKWIEAGHAFSAMHSGSDTLHDFPGFREMLQAEFKTHGDQTPADLIAGDKAHPANAGIGDTWDIKQEEMYLFKEGTHDRAKVRELWYMRHAPMNKNKEEFVPVSWCRMAGKGKVFYTSLGHREDLWDETDAVKDRINPPEISKQYQAHIMGGMKWALGLADGSATPNPEAK